MGQTAHLKVLLLPLPIGCLLGMDIPQTQFAPVAVLLFKFLHYRLQFLETQYSPKTNQLLQCTRQTSLDIHLARHKQVQDIILIVDPRQCLCHLFIRCALIGVGSTSQHLEIRPDTLINGGNCTSWRKERHDLLIRPCLLLLPSILLILEWQQGTYGNKRRLIINGCPNKRYCGIGTRALVMPQAL